MILEDCHTLIIYKTDTVSMWRIFWQPLETVLNLIHILYR